jgi:hypothetical protein
MAWFNKPKDCSLERGSFLLVLYYIMDKPLDLRSGLYQVPFPKSVVEWVDKMIEFKSKNHCHDMVLDEQDWDLIEFLYKGWEVIYPIEAREFFDSMDYIRAHTVNHGVSKDRGEATIQHQLEIPENFYKMFRVMFPYQNWDKKFVTKFINRFKQFKVNL